MGFAGSSHGKASAYNAGHPGLIPGEDFLEKEMASHSSILAWRFSWMEEPGGLQSVGSQRVGHDWVTKLNWCVRRWCSGKESTWQYRRWRFDPWVRKIPWRRKWQLTPVFLPGKFHGQMSLVGCSPWGPKESDTTEHAPTCSHMFYHCVISVKCQVNSWYSLQK